MSAVPHYATGVDFHSPSVRKDAFDVMARLVEHYRATTTDMVESQWREPVQNYIDPELWQREVQAIHRTRPLPVALSCELPTAGSYKALDVVGTPIILTRERDGDLRALVNSCRHRGGELVPEGTGHARRFTCPYHAWSYDLAGCLTGVYGEETFGPIERSDLGLRQLPVGERAGIRLVSVTPGAGFDLDAGVGPQLLEQLEALGLADCCPPPARMRGGANWKVRVDGYLEGYHFASLHRTTVFRTNLSNMAAFDAWGPHQRNSFALRPIAEAAEPPPETWDPRRSVGASYWLFPRHVLLGGGPGPAAVSLVVPRPGHRRGVAGAGGRLLRLPRFHLGQLQDRAAHPAAPRTGRRRGAQERRPHPRLVPRRRARRGLQRGVRHPAGTGRHGRRGL